MKELLRVTCKGAATTRLHKAVLGAIDQSVFVSESPEDKRDMRLQRGKSSSCISNKSGSKRNGASIFRGQAIKSKYKSSLEA